MFGVKDAFENVIYGLVGKTNGFRILMCLKGRPWVIVH